MRPLLPLIFVASLSGCAGLSSDRLETASYSCDGGRAFSVSYHPGGQTAMIEIDRMRFGLNVEAPDGPGQRYGCSVLTLWRDGDKARVEMEGVPAYTNCRVAAGG